MSLPNACPKPGPKVKAPKPRKPRQRVKQVNRERQARVRDRAYLDWVKTQPCLAAGKAEFPWEFCSSLGERRGVEPAHVKTKGSGGADRGNTVPLCPSHHDEQEGDTEGFEDEYGINLKLEAAKLLVRYIEAGEP